MLADANEAQMWGVIWTVAAFVLGLPIYLYLAGRLTWWQVKQVWDFFAVIFGRAEPREPQTPAEKLPANDRQNQSSAGVNVTVSGPPADQARVERDQLGPDRGRREPDLPF